MASAMNFSLQFYECADTDTAKWGRLKCYEIVCKWHFRRIGDYFLKYYLSGLKLILLKINKL